MTSSVKKSELHPNSALQAYLRPGDFVDCYSVHSPLPARQAAEIIANFPTWANALVNLRNKLVTPFGLQGEGPIAADTVGIFPVVEETPEEVIAGFDDKHLNFRISVSSVEDTVSLATWVHRNNLGGRIYLSLILPFHILIARDALARVAQQGSMAPNST